MFPIMNQNHQGIPLSQSHSSGPGENAGSSGEAAVVERGSVVVGARGSVGAGGGVGPGGSGSSEIVVVVPSVLGGGSGGGSVSLSPSSTSGSVVVVEVEVVVVDVDAGAASGSVVVVEVVEEVVGAGTTGGAGSGPSQTFWVHTGTYSGSSQLKLPSAETLLSSGSSQFEIPSQSLSRFTSTIENLSPVGATPALMMLV